MVNEATIQSPGGGGLGRVAGVFLNNMKFSARRRAVLKKKIVCVMMGQKLQPPPSGD